MQGVPTELIQEEIILKNTFMNAKMGPIAHYLGGNLAHQTKNFIIRWPDEPHNQANSHPSSRPPLVHEIIEKPGAKSNHKNIKASQLKSNFKVRIC